MTRLADLQAQVRAAQLKARDIDATRLVIVATGTHANRRALADARPSLVQSFELDTRTVLAALAAGRDPWPRRVHPPLTAYARVAVSAASWPA